MRRGGFQRVAVIVALVAATTWVTSSQDEPQDTGIVERTGTRLVQLDVSVSGPADLIENLGPEDFRLKVNLVKIENFLVDRVCRHGDSAVPVMSAEASQPGGTTPEEADAAIPMASPAVPASPPATFLFYIDQPNLTMAGRAGALNSLREMIPDLFEGGNARGMLIYNGRDLDITTDMTSNPDELLDGLRLLGKENRNWLADSMEEDTRIAEVIRRMDDDTDQALAQARIYQKDELWRMEKSVQRVTMVLGLMSEIDPPKAFVYFADTFRKNPGQHYMSYFSSPMGFNQESISSVAAAVNSSSFLTENTFSRLLDKAASMGVRFYTVQAEGMVGEEFVVGRPQSPSGAVIGNMQKVRDAQDTLVSMGVETGGRAFLNGVPPRKMTRAILDDLSCMYLISFDPGTLPQDKPLTVALKSSHKKLKIQTRGRIVIRSAGTRRTDRLLAAFATSREDDDGEHPIRGTVVPTDFRDGEYSALLQVSIPATEVVGATWDIGTSIVARGKVREDASGRVTTPQPGVPIAFEAVVTFPPGPYELVTVAHETTTDQVFSRRFDGTWPDPNDSPAMVSPVAILQPGTGAFVRDGETKNRGALALGDDPTLEADRATALVGLVCRAKGNRRELRVERELSGENAVQFPTLSFGAEDRCVQLRDLVPGGTMSAGAFAYQVQVFEGDEVVASGSTRFGIPDDSATP